MDLFWKCAAAALICVILGITLKKWEQNFSLLLSIMICCMIGIVVVSFLSPVMDLLHQLVEISNISISTLGILLKVVGISFVGEIVSLICTDSGNSSIAKILGFLTDCVILWLSIPIINQFIDLLKQILGAV